MLITTTPVQTSAQPTATDQLITDTLQSAAQLAREARLFVLTAVVAHAAVLLNLLAVVAS
jgi:hypothetical protein